MEFLLVSLVFIVMTVIVISILNEKVLHISNEIALLLFAFAGSILIKLIIRTGIFCIPQGIAQELKSFRFEEFLMDGVLCFMLFSGAGKVHFSKFINNIKCISMLAVFSTLISAAVYGLLFFAAGRLFNINLDIWSCLLLGCIIAPTDPIAATGILNKLGLSKNVSTVIEGESLFNDGIGVTLFILVKSIICKSEETSFALLIIKEFACAVLTALVVSYLLFKLLRLTNDPIKHILISILDVSLSYVICEKLGFSGAIASVVCGMYFSVAIEKCERWRLVVDPKGYYMDFWDILDNLLNSILFSLIGISIINIPSAQAIVRLGISAVIINLLSRLTGVWCTGVIIGEKSLPSRYSVIEFVMLMTWSGIKGGLSLALAFTTAEFLPEYLYNIILSTTYITIFFTTIIQGLTTAKVFRAIETLKKKRIASNN